MIDNSPLRWHPHPNPALRLSGDTVRLHSERVVALCQELAARIGHPLHSSDLPRAALHHDDCETITGDWPATLMQQYPWVRLVKIILEWQIGLRLGLRWRLSRHERRMLDLCDKLDARLWARRCGVNGGEWDEAETRLRRMAWRLGPDAVTWVDERLGA